jgi:hypothetical protein
MTLLSLLTKINYTIMNNKEQTDRELEQFLLELNQRELTEELVKEQITGSLKRLEELHYEIARIGLDLEILRHN